MLQVGGDDQWGNILAGTDLVRRVHQAETYALTFPLITTASGAKMGKTAAGVVWLSAERTSPFDFYQYFVNVDDRDVIRFLKLLTFVSLDEIQRFAALEGAELSAAKQALAAAVTELVHGKEEAEKGQRAARAAFAGGGDGALVPSYSVTPAALTHGLKIVDLLHASGLATSKSVARRLVEQGGVRLGERKVTSVDDLVRPEEIADEGTLLHAGKKHLRRLVVDR
jgi:tyrosyl-tRNA synthetase